MEEVEFIENQSQDTANTLNSYLSQLTNDTESAKIISPAYSGRNSELTAILQYIYYAVVLDKENYNDIAKQLMEIGEDEMHHFHILAQTLIRLGVDPIYTLFPPQRDCYYTTRYVCYVKEISRILKKALLDENNAIKMYTEMISKLKNEPVKQIITILKDKETEHAKTLLGIIERLKDWF